MTSHSCRTALLLWGLLLVVYISKVHCILLPTPTTELSVSAVDDNRLLNASRITVGRASDLALQVRCTSSPDNNVTSWSHGNGTIISEGLRLFGVSQSAGVLRVYPVTLLSLGPNDFSCSDGSQSLSVQFDLIPHLFFTSPVPAQAVDGTDITSLCPVSDIPTANVTVVNETAFSYCRVATERGSFRSRSIATEEAVPSFEYEPVDLELNPFNETSRAAFSCGVRGIKPIASIEWYFEMMMFGSGSGLGPGLMNGVVTPGMGVAISSDSNRASVLVIEDAGNQEEGFYRCEVTFTDGLTLSSRNASLTYNSTSLAEESIALSPPSAVSVYEGQSLLLPCVSTGPTRPTFSRVTDGNVMTSVTMGVSEFGLEMSVVTIGDSGVYTCTIGITTANVMVTVTSLFPPDTAFVSVSSGNFAAPPESITADFFRLRCQSSELVELVLLQNIGSLLSVGPAATNLFANMVATTGFYQCASARFSDSDNLYASEDESVYVIIAFLANTTVSPPVSVVMPPSGSTNVTLICTTNGNPLPSLSWTVDNVLSSDGIQEVTGFLETATSNLTLSSDQLGLGVHTVACTASTVSVPSVTRETNITVQAVPVVTSPPMDSTVLAPEQAQFSCTAEGFPLPSITWVTVADDNSVETTLTTGGNIVITQSNTLARANSTLVLLTTMLEQSGRYACVASNTLGADNDSAILIVNAVPVVTSPPVDSTVLAPEQAQFSCTVEGFPLPTVTWVTVTDDTGTETTLTPGDNIVITENITNSFSVTSNLTVLSTDFSLTGVYVCVANNSQGMVNSSATLTVNVLPRFLLSPVPDVLAVTGNDITLNCSAEGNPLPTITWTINTTNGTISTTDDNFDITFSNNSIYLTSVLRFTVAVDDPLRGNGSTYYCRAANGLGEGAESNSTLLTVAGPPLAPDVMIVPTARAALLTWATPFSLLPLTNYLVNVSVGGELITMETLPGDSVGYNATSLRPAVEHSVSVVAVNPAGVGVVTVRPFTTLEDVPDGFPGDVRTTSTQLNSIAVTWSPPPANETNGFITGYTVQYRTSVSSPPQFTNTSALSATLTVVAGNTYFVSVAARTAIGLGPYSEPEVIQMTIPVPVTFPPSVAPSTGSDGPTVNTVPFTLPAVAAGSFSHYWIVVIRLDDTTTFDPMENPSQVFPDASAFGNYSSHLVLPNSPYIAAEISADNYQGNSVFVIGDEAGTMSINDFPLLYENGPLLEGAEYTAFVRAFTNTVPAGTRLRRQVQGRQYVVFVSSSFLTPVRTPTSGLTGGVIAGIAVGILFILIILTIIIIVIVIMYERFHYTKEYGLPQPPSRKGSVRHRDQREIVSTALTLRNHKAEASLVNLDPGDSRLPVLVEDFPSYVKSMHANTDHLFSEEYEILSIKSPSLPHVQCSLPYNVVKNRYANINCFDDTRVKLNAIPGIDGSDYINANYVDGYLEKRGFIASQGPLAQTTQDFWRMIWEHNSCCIIMLTNVVEKNRAKCHQYWPEVGSQTLDDITVTLIETQQLAYYTVRTFRMSRGNDRREVKQFHYTGWPDFGVPDYPHPVIAFIKRINNFKRTTPGPYIIHCSAGVGRTGTMMSIQAMMQMLEEEGKLDIFNFVLGLRHQRNYMVQTERQYIFTHDCILEILKIGETSIPIQTLRRRHKELLAHDPHLDTSKMEAEYARLNELQILEEGQFEPAQLPANKPKNRFEHILPYDRYRVRLLLHPGVVGSDYVNASYIDGYQHRHQYIVTQGPMKHTVTDFWRLVWEHRVSCILMLCPLEEKGKEQCVRYWPTEKIIQQGDMFIELTQLTDYGSYTMREFSITNTKINESRVIKHYQYSDWLEDTMPTNAATVIDLIGVLQKSQHMLGGGPIVVHDSSSIGRSATFCVLGSVLEQLKVEGIVDLFAAIHALRHQQPGLVNSFELYKFCYQAVLEFLDSFDHYANFD